MLQKTIMGAAALLLTAGLLAGGAQAQSTAQQTAPGAAAPAPVTGPRAAAPAPTAGTSTTKRSSAASSKLDINTASTADLSALPGMTPAYSQAVIAGRPYRRKTDLVRKKIVPQTVYSGISDKIIAHRVKS